MGDFFGPLERTLIGVAVLLLGLYYGLSGAFPEWSAPELRQVSEDFPGTVDEQPRKGKIVPSGSLNSYWARQAAELKVDEFIHQPPPNEGGVDFKSIEINILTKGVDGQMHPANAYLKGFIPFTTDKYWVPLMAVSLRVRYMRDDAKTTEKNIDIWQTSPYTYRNMEGDCEDFAILLADWMMGLGYDARVVGGTVHGEGHAWVVLERDGEEYLLEATGKGSRRSFPVTRLHPEYVPEFMFNRDNFWVRNKKGPYQFSEPEEPWFWIAEFVDENAGK